MRKIWIFLLSEFIAGLIMINFLFNIKWLVFGFRIAYFNSVVWAMIIFCLIWYAIYNSPYSNKLKENEKRN